MQRKSISQEEARAKTTAWALTFADLTTLLLTFFVLLLVILNDAEAHVDRLVNIILNETEKELKPLQQNNLVEIERINKLKDSSNKLKINNSINQKQDFKDFGIGAQIIHDIGISKIKILSNSGEKPRVGLSGYGLSIDKYIRY